MSSQPHYVPGVSVGPQRPYTVSHASALDLEALLTDPTSSSSSSSPSSLSAPPVADNDDDAGLETRQRTNNLGRTGGKQSFAPFAPPQHHQQFRQHHQQQLFDDVARSATAASDADPVSDNDSDRSGADAWGLFSAAALSSWLGAEADRRLALLQAPRDVLGAHSTGSASQAIRQQEQQPWQQNRDSDPHSGVVSDAVIGAENDIDALFESVMGRPMSAHSSSVSAAGANASVEHAARSANATVTTGAEGDVDAEVDAEADAEAAAAKAEEAALSEAAIRAFAVMLPSNTSVDDNGYNTNMNNSYLSNPGDIDANAAAIDALASRAGDTTENDIDMDVSALISNRFAGLYANAHLGPLTPPHNSPLSPPKRQQEQQQHVDSSHASLDGAASAAASSTVSANASPSPADAAFSYADKAMSPLRALAAHGPSPLAELDAAARLLRQVLTAADDSNYPQTSHSHGQEQEQERDGPRDVAPAASSATSVGSDGMKATSFAFPAFAWQPHSNNNTNANISLITEPNTSGSSAPAGNNTNSSLVTNASSDLAVAALIEAHPDATTEELIALLTQQTLREQQRAPGQGQLITDSNMTAGLDVNSASPSTSQFAHRNNTNITEDTRKSTTDTSSISPSPSSTSALAKKSASVPEDLAPASSAPALQDPDAINSKPSSLRAEDSSLRSEASSLRLALASATSLSSSSLRARARAEALAQDLTARFAAAGREWSQLLTRLARAEQETAAVTARAKHDIGTLLRRLGAAARAANAAVDVKARAEQESQRLRAALAARDAAQEQERERGAAAAAAVAAAKEHIATLARALAVAETERAAEAEAAARAAARAAAAEAMAAGAGVRAAAAERVGRASQEQAQRLQRELDAALAKLAFSGTSPLSASSAGATGGTAPPPAPPAVSGVISFVASDKNAKGNAAFSSRVSSAASTSASHSVTSGDVVTGLVSPAGLIALAHAWRARALEVESAAAAEVALLTAQAAKASGVAAAAEASAAAVAAAAETEAAERRRLQGVLAVTEAERDALLHYSNSTNTGNGGNAIAKSVTGSAKSSVVSGTCLMKCGRCGHMNADASSNHDHDRDHNNSSRASCNHGSANASVNRSSGSNVANASSMAASGASPADLTTRAVPCSNANAVPATTPNGGTVLVATLQARVAALTAALRDRDDAITAWQRQEAALASELARRGDRLGAERREKDALRSKCEALVAQLAHANAMAKP